mmetsp:Transcript_19560/g.55143  ORF Transcript_19560/g.55143 Transcript_19560/m.55143 type:complete len:203 (+) Transcript_19560:420-1028(+)
MPPVRPNASGKACSKRPSKATARGARRAKRSAAPSDPAPCPRRIPARSAGAARSARRAQQASATPRRSGALTSVRRRRPRMACRDRAQAMTQTMRIFRSAPSAPACCRPKEYWGVARLSTRSRAQADSTLSPASLKEPRDSATTDSEEASTPPSTCKIMSTRDTAAAALCRWIWAASIVFSAPFPVSCRAIGDETSSSAIML